MGATFFFDSKFAGMLVSTLTHSAQLSAPPIPPRPPTPDRYLVYAAHNGFGNQHKALRKAILLAYQLKRTLVLPPLLKHYDLECGEICCKVRIAKRVRQGAVALYEKKAKTAGEHESLTRVFDFAPLAKRYGVRTLDFPAFLRAQGGDWRAGGVHPVLHVCKDTRRWGPTEFEQRLGAARVDARVLQFGSLYWFNIEGLMEKAPAAAALWDELEVLPPSAAVSAWMEAAAAALAPRYAAVHVRSLGYGDYSSLGEVISLWSASELVSHNATDVFVATDLRKGLGDPLLAALARAPFRSVDLGTLLGARGLEKSAAWKGLREGAGGLSVGSASLVADMSVCARAPGGFFSPSMHGAPSNQLLRVSSFSDIIQWAWERRHASTVRASTPPMHGVARLLRALQPWPKRLNVTAHLSPGLLSALNDPIAGRKVRVKRGSKPDAQAIV